MAQNFLSNPELLRQIQQMAASTIQPNEPLKDVVSSQPTQMEDEANYPQDMQSSPQLSVLSISYFSFFNKLLNCAYVSGFHFIFGMRER